MIIIIESLAIENTQYDYEKVKSLNYLELIYIHLFKTFQQQISGRNKYKREKFHAADENQLPSERSRTYILTMLPADKGDHVFNGEGEQEWEIQGNTNIKFAIYGM